MLSYDQNIFEKYKALSIQTINQLEIGKQYWTNHLPKTFFVNELITWAEKNRREGKEPFDLGNDLEWIVYSRDDNREDYISIHDRNIGAHYNPWLIFDSEETAKNCRDELNPTVAYANANYFVDDYSDFYDDYYNDCPPCDSPYWDY